MHFLELIKPYYGACCICKAEDLIEKGHSTCNYCRQKPTQGRCLDCGGDITSSKTIQGEPVHFCHWCLEEKINEAKKSLKKTLDEKQVGLFNTIEMLNEYKVLAS